MEERLKNLEAELSRTQRRVRLLCLFVLATPVVLVAALAFQPGSVAAKPRSDKPGTVVKAPLEVVGAKGNRLMAVEEDGDGAVVRFYRTGNKIYGMFDCSPAGGSLALFTPDEKMGVVLDSVVDGGSVGIYNSAGREGVMLRTTSSLGTKFVLSDKVGTAFFTKP